MNLKHQHVAVAVALLVLGNSAAKAGQTINETSRSLTKATKPRPECAIRAGSIGTPLPGLTPGDRRGRTRPHVNRASLLPTIGG
jgi:hypothetical protein